MIVFEKIPFKTDLIHLGHEETPSYLVINWNMGNHCTTHCSLLKSRELFWWKWLLGQSVAALNFKSFWRAMEQSGADENGMGVIPTSLGAQNTNQICRQMRLDLTIPNSLI